MPRGPREPAACPPPRPGKAGSLQGWGLPPEPRRHESHYGCLSHLHPRMEKGWGGRLGTGSCTLLLSSAPRALSGGAGGGAQAGREVSTARAPGEARLGLGDTAAQTNEPSPALWCSRWAASVLDNRPPHGAT